ncbi:hypothetical protein F5X96DRAFT_371130 [Biscogniauxia mediterranea]|nr:hypothetical protein F5X96DRAFT_371130 [Biscogniauxia mediterranea]
MISTRIPNTAPITPTLLYSHARIRVRRTTSPDRSHNQCLYFISVDFYGLELTLRYTRHRLSGCLLCVSLSTEKCGNLVDLVYTDVHRRWYTMESNEFDWPGAHFLTTGSPHDPGSNFQLPAHDDGPIGPWDQLASMTGMQGDEMDWNFYDRPRQPSNPNQFPTGPPAEPAHHRAGIIHGGAPGYLNHQAAGVTNGLPTPPTYGATSSMSLCFGEPAHAQSSAYVEPALTGQAGAMGGFGKREVAYGESSGAPLPFYLMS